MKNYERIIVSSASFDRCDRIDLHTTSMSVDRQRLLRVAVRLEGREVSSSLRSLCKRDGLDIGSS